MNTPDRGTILRFVVLIVLIALVVPFALYAVPNAVGADHSYVVLSGSMEPTISTGDAVLVAEQSPESIERGDIITFATEDEATPTTHRVVEIIQTDEGREFVTKGDANENRDPQQVSDRNIIGTLAFSIPFIGYVIKFAGTQMGFLALVGIPLGLLILGELYDLAVAARSTPTETDGAADANSED